MNRLQRSVDHPLVSYLVIGSFSLLSAWICWRLGGSVAEVVTPDAGVGATIELGGAVAGFAAMFLLSLWVFGKLHQLRRATRTLRVFLIPREQFQAGSDYTCFVTVYDGESGDERRLPVTPRRENGYLTIDLLDLHDGEMFQIEVQDGTKTWRSDYSPVAATRAEMLPA
jgi:hypothetical protein